MPAADEAISTQDMIARRSRLLGPAYRLFYEQPVQLVRGEGVWLYDADGRALSRRLQQRRLRRALPSARRRGDRAAGGRAQHAYALSARDRARLRRGAARDLSGRARPGHVHLHRQRGQRPRSARRANLHRRHRLHRHRKRLSRRHQRAGGAVALARAAVVPAAATCGTVAGARARPRDAGEPSRVTSSAALADLKRHGIRPAALLVDTIFSSDGVFADPPGFLRPAVEARPGGRRRCSSPTRCSPASAAPASRCGASRATASCPTSSPWASRWATAIPSPAMAARPELLADVRRGGPLLQHLRRQPGLRRRRHGGARRDRSRRVDAERAAHRRLSDQAAHGRCRRGTR